MFSVIFEVHPRREQWDAYLDSAQMLRPELVQVDGFIDNIRYKSLTREGLILSLSGWRDEKAVVRWRTKMRHHICGPRFWTILHSPYARARLNRNLELSRRINIFVTHDEQKITTLHEVSWMRPRVPPTPPM
jgi:hypothetical protein